MRPPVDLRLVIYQIKLLTLLKVDSFFLLDAIMDVLITLREGEGFSSLVISVAVEDGVPVYPDCIVCDRPPRVWVRKAGASQGKAVYDLALSHWLANKRSEK